MSQERFHQQHAADWQALEEALAALEGGKDGDYTSFSAQYRRLCQHLALARHRDYSPDLLARLGELALRGHQQLYGQRPPPPSLGGMIRGAIPAAMRRARSAVGLACLLFVGPALGLYAAVRLQPELIHSVIDPRTLAEIEAMYDPSGAHFLKEREAGSDVMMLGYYIRNNIGIGFRTFASGLFFGLGSMFFLAFNGVYMGAVAAHLDNTGYGETFYPFVVGHGAFELTAIVISGAAGLKLGLALLAPGRRTRAQALQEEARAALPLVYAFFGMLVVAAFIEAFWSPRILPAAVKFGVGAGLWALVLAWLGGVGRRHAA